ncbi:MAG: monovalent cation/H(+) antiporter subunit G [Gammaproteobacteria bacterium]|nr:monovalent cation/H(+) antiporter subunit G [Gammaproteobacteria bacterium]
MELLSALFIFIGALFTVIAALGILRFPDLLLRMHAATKAGSLGVGLVMFGVMFHFLSLMVTIKAILIILFIFITTPIGAHMLARAAYFIKIPLWSGTITDELRDHYDAKTHELEGKNSS